MLQLTGALMRKFLLASVAIAGLAGSTFDPNAFAAPGDQPPAPNPALMEQLQERQAVVLDAHLAAMKAGLKLTDEQAKNWPAFESSIRDAEKARADRLRQAEDRMSSRRAPLADRTHDDDVRASSEDGGATQGGRGCRQASLRQPHRRAKARFWFADERVQVAQAPLAMIFAAAIDARSRRETATR